MLSKHVSFSTSLGHLNLWKRELTTKWFFIKIRTIPFLLHWLICCIKLEKSFPMGNISSSILWFDYWIKYKKIVLSLWPVKLCSYLTIHFRFSLDHHVNILSTVSLLPRKPRTFSSPPSLLTLPLKCDSSDFPFKG